MEIRELPTPCLLVDRPTLEENLRRMAQRTADLGVRLRPHVKTHKCLEIARLQQPGGGCLAVSTLAEARFFAAGGFEDLVYAVPVAAGRWPEIGDLAGRLRDFQVLVDSMVGIQAAAALAAARSLSLSLWLKVDCGYHRCGVDPVSLEAVELAQAIDGFPQLRFRGLLTHGGHAYDCADLAAAEVVAGQERDAVVQLAERLRQAGLQGFEVSVGSTPTLTVVRNLAGVDEARPGNYVFYDGFQRSLGTCRESDIALSVLTTVIGCYPQRQALVLDAGALALSKDPGRSQVPEDGLAGEFIGGRYGVLTDLEGRPLPELRLESLSQEHGKVLCASSEVAARYPVGSRLRVLPNHSCLTAAAHEAYWIVKEGQVEDRWRRCGGW